MLYINKYKLKTALPILACMICSCNNSQNNTTPAAIAPARMNTMDTTVKTIAYAVDNKRDPVCGMPVSAGISDTCSYNGNIIGLCSPECKADFIKDPEAFIKDVQLKNNK